MEIFELDPDEFNAIRPLWEALNQLHYQRSGHFKAHFASFTFEARMKEMETKEQVTIFAARPAGQKSLAGYCMASLDSQDGELDSLFVSPACQGKGVGAGLAGKAMAWLRSRGATRIRICVAQGNEEVLGFYERLGFFPRLTVLELAEH